MCRHMRHVGGPGRSCPGVVRICRLTHVTWSPKSGWEQKGVALGIKWLESICLSHARGQNPTCLVRICHLTARMPRASTIMHVMIILPALIDLLCPFPPRTASPGPPTCLHMLQLYRNMRKTHREKILTTFSKRPSIAGTIS